ncbi:LysE/ArgO family amino acid transporter [Pseudoduganella chitinolytica]|uniref:LysE family transporter n=1 Tax=Pseudoduganella chitinolytica TaxID=34070 RepID=A0ABY8BF43_9BURK|nr:LysE family transporter [Pseudoduganella chitinolytica]WEF34527.1 LysE family transporter [Pseudoduganella chitinolytica]
MGLIVAIGPKDAYVIRQSLLGRHLLVMMGICVGADVALIALGTLGLGTIVARYDWVMQAAAIGGALFLCWHGLVALRSAMGETAVPDLSNGADISLRQVVSATCVMSFLNPLALLDSGLLIGVISGTKPDSERLGFAAGAVSASVLWFALLIGGARVVAPLFRMPIMWKVLDFAIAAIMFTMAFVTASSVLDRGIPNG